MPRYYFHLRHPGKRVMDCEGVLLPSADAARAQAILTVRDFFRPALNAVEPEWADCALEVRDARGCRVADIAFAEAARPAAGNLEMAHVAPPLKVIHLDLARARREFSAVESRARELLQQMRSLVQKQRSAAQNVSDELRHMNELRNSSIEIVARARRQSGSGESQREAATG